MFSFPPLINNSVAIGLSFLLLSISAIISSNTINIFCFLFGLYSSIFLLTSSISFEYSMKAFEPFKYFKPVLFLLLMKNQYFVSYGSFVCKYILQVSCSLLMRLSNAFFFQNQNLHLLIFCMDKWEFLVNLDYVILCLLL